MKKLSFSFVVLAFLIVSPVVAVALPLYTNSRWIVDEDGQRVKLACVNWASHLEAMVAEGLSKRPLDVISKRIVSMGFNCVRLTWPLFLATNDSLASVTVRQSFRSLGLSETIVGIQVNNPSLVDLPLIQAYQAVVSNLGENNLMVILDNHISKPGWCCSSFDGNGFFGDKYFDPGVWIKGLTSMATMFNATPNVVGMSLRNELRGNKQNVKDWYRYMQQGGEAVHSANPDVLVILSGLNYDKDFSFLAKQPLNLTFSGKLVFELHWYAFSDGKAWETGNPNQVCATVVNNLMRKGGFLLDRGWPLFISEFGVDQRGTNVNDNRFLNCFLGVAAQLDWDWALWTLVGRYYLRQGVVGMDETYGVLSWDWNNIRNSTFVQQISALQSPFQGPGLSSEVTPHKVIFHPSTGLCVVRKSLMMELLKLGSCTESEAWSYTPEKTLSLKDTNLCLQADELGEAAKLGIICSDLSSRWDMISDSKMHISSNLTNGSTVCIDVDSNTNTIITSQCKCLTKDHTCDPSGQWFIIVNSTRSTTATKFSLTTVNRKSSIVKHNQLQLKSLTKGGGRSSLWPFTFTEPITNLDNI
ncbi:PREDICTED: uncharacterized protein LOC104593039 [Nelumbo nucifera]|uniref:Uncharacterized protein LOC104593039 n=2 Tax=Nelumbo nucifera TaxID=4432 RepID=A0A1U7ZBQ6_NELNU|nr:PREDICTED: uncharacterized protein LOC104593039 [Nelumbo nucifera]DAD34407.1 TPA_asm: hypothetical protein HUJ06_005047 [Nelumbo nucifera]